MTILEQLQIWQEELIQLQRELAAVPKALLHDMQEELFKFATAVSSTQQIVERRASGQVAIPRAGHSERRIDLSLRSYLETNPHGVIRRTNNATALLLNFPRHLIVGQPLLVFVKKDERTAFLTAFQELRYGKGSKRGEYLVTIQPVGLPSQLAMLIGERVEDDKHSVLGITWILTPT